MRTIGIPIRILGPGLVQANCRIHRAGLHTRFPSLEPVVYREHDFLAERGSQSDPRAELLCPQCNCQIDVRHPSTCLLTALWFPEAPPRLVALGERRVGAGLEVTAIACSPDGRRAAVAAGTGNTPQSLSIWDLARREQVGELPAHGELRCLAWNSEEQTLVTGRGNLRMRGRADQGPSLFVWNVAEGAERLRFGRDLFGIRGMAISPDGRCLLSSGLLGKTELDGSALDLWDLASGQLAKRLASLEHHGEPVLPVFESVAFSPDGALAIAACSACYAPHAMQEGSGKPLAQWNRGVRAWRVSDGQEVEILPLPLPVYDFSSSADGTKLFFQGQAVGMWSLSLRRLLWDKHNSCTHAIAATDDCGLVARAIGERDKLGPWEECAVEIYEGNTGELLTLGLHRTPPGAIAFTPDGSLLVAGGLEGELTFWTMPSLR